MADIPWNREVPDGWVDQVAAWPWSEWTHDGARLGWRKVGPCPRCTHTMAVYQERLRGVLPVPPAKRVRAWCNCVADHTGRPEDESGGCGVGVGTDLVVPGVAS